MHRNCLIIIILLLFFGLWMETSKAESIATMPNKAGGQFVLSDIKCTDKPGYVAYATAKSASTLFGCWFYDDQYVHIMWSDGDTRSYNRTGWTVVKSGKSI